MDRRKAIKNIGTGIGAITLTPSIATIFQSCQSSTGYIPVFIPKRDFNSISQIMELIISLAALSTTPSSPNSFFKRL